MNEFTSGIYRNELRTESTYCQGIFIVKQVLKNKDSSVSLKCSVSALFDSSQLDVSKEFDQNLLMFVKTTSPLVLFPGDIVRAEGWLSAIKAPQNPNAFDARTYYNTLGIRHQLYCKQQNLNVEGKDGFSIARITAQWQRILSETVRSHTSPQVAQLINALVWGDRSDMDSEVRDAFADSGAMHVLSVSGMHVAIIYTMLMYLLGQPGAGPLLQRITRFLLYSFAIVLYIGLTGACPAVVRAGLMIILYLFGKSMGWNTSVWNLLGFAAFLMIWINPFVWQNIGFQLSFLAMAGLLLFAKPIIRSLTVKNVLLHKCWEITALSISAQVFILPVLLSQFHQFPLTFIISSIVAIPAAFVIMFGAILNIILSFVGLDILWKALDWSGILFIKCMQWMSGLNPLMHFSLPSFSANALMTMAVLFSLALVFSWNAGRKLAWLFGITTFVSLGCHRADVWSKSSLVMYHSPKGLLIDIVDDGKCYSVFDCSLSPAGIEFMTRGYRCAKDIINVENICKYESYEGQSFTYTEAVITTKANRFLIWNDSTDVNEGLSNLTHIIIEECNDIENLRAYTNCTENLKFIIPAHINRYVRKEIVDMFIDYDIDYYDIEVRGYYSLQL